MENRFRKYTLLVCILTTLVTFIAGLAACGAPSDNETFCYYLSLKSDSYKVYQSEEEIPERIKFQKEDGNRYTLTIDLDQDEEFTVNRIGAEEKIGYDQLLSALGDLSEGENGTIRVVHGGDFHFTYSPEDDALLYSFGNSGGEQGTEPVSGVELDQEELSLELNAEAKLTATVLPANAQNKNVIWDSDDEEVVTVTPDGLVKAVGYGTAKITVTTMESGYTAECVVTVIRHVSSLMLEYSRLKLEVGTTTALKIDFSPIEATNKSYGYSIETGDEYVELSRDENGSALNIKGLTVGSAAIVITSDDNPEIDAACMIEVVEKDSAFINIPQNLQVTIGQEQSLSVSVNNIENYTIGWAVENDDVVTIDGENERINVTGVNFGSTSVTVTVTQGETAYTAKTDILVADEYFFIYGIGIVEEGDWSWENYISDRSAAEAAGILFKEQSRGVYTLTRYFAPSNGFQIIFPRVNDVNLQDENGEWGKNIPSELIASSSYYDSKRSDGALLANAPTQFKVKYAGEYTVTLDLTGSSAKVYIKNVSVNVKEIHLSVESGSVLLHRGESVTLNVNVNPARATFSGEDIGLSLGGQENNFEYAFDFSGMTLTVRAKEDASVCSVVLTCSIKGITGSIELFVIDEDSVPVTSLSFEHDSYTFNVNNGGLAWEQQVRAFVNEDATVQAVKYSLLCSDANFSVNEDTGVVTAVMLGTGTILATAVGDESITAVCTVTFYSDSFYLTGEFNESRDFDYVPISQTSLEGTKFAKYLFTMDSCTHFTLTTDLEAYKMVSHLEYGFQIVHLGMDDSWDSAIGNVFLDSSGCYNPDLLDKQQQNLRVKQTGAYVLELDLSGEMPRWTINIQTESLHELFLTTSADKLKKGETAQIELAFGPGFAQPVGEVVWSATAQNDKQYVSLNFDDEKNVCTVTVDNAEFSNEDISVTITCTVDSIESSVTITVLAEHHLVYESDNELHWQVCTDAGCSYETEHERHTRDAKWDFDGQYHFHACDVCGAGKVDVSEHSFTVYADGWYIDEGLCEQCGFQLYTFENGTITKYNGQISKLEIPSQIKGKTVTEIGEKAFAGNLYLTEIELPNSVTKLGKYVFDGCSNLVRIDLGEGVTVLPWYLFQDCVSLKNITMGAITSIQMCAFRNCSSLTTFTIPDTVREIQLRAFEGVSAEILWGDAPALTTLNGFQGYLGTSFTIPSSIITLADACFAGSNLVSIVAPDKAKLPYGSCFAGCKNLRWVELGSAAERIPQGTFSGCESLEYVLLKSSNVYEIGVAAFYECYSLKAVYCETPRNVLIHEDYDRFITNVNGQNNSLIGKLFAYANKEYTVPHPDFGTLWAKYFGGTWYYDDSGIESLEHVVNGQEALEEETASLDSATPICDFKRKESL